MLVGNYSRNDDFPWAANQIKIIKNYSSYKCKLTLMYIPTFLSSSRYFSEWIHNEIILKKWDGLLFKMFWRVKIKPNQTNFLLNMRCKCPQSRWLWLSHRLYVCANDIMLCVIVVLTRNRFRLALYVAWKLKCHNWIGNMESWNGINSFGWIIMLINHLLGREEFRGTGKILHWNKAI